MCTSIENSRAGWRGAHAERESRLEAVYHNGTRVGRTSACQTGALNSRVYEKEGAVDRYGVSDQARCKRCVDWRFARPTSPDDRATRHADEQSSSRQPPRQETVFSHARTMRSTTERSVVEARTRTHHWVDAARSPPEKQGERAGSTATTIVRILLLQDPDAADHPPVPEPYTTHRRCSICSHNSGPVVS